jgi:hypothetical protein
MATGDMTASVGHRPRGRAAMKGSAAASELQRAGPAEWIRSGE